MLKSFTPGTIADGILSGEIECKDGKISHFSGKFLNSCNLSMIERGVLQINFCADKVIDRFTPQGQNRIKEAIEIATAK